MILAFVALLIIQQVLAAIDGCGVGGGNSSGSGDCCRANPCTRGIDILQYKDFSQVALTIGATKEDYSFVPGTSGTISGGNIFCTSNSPCFVQSNRIFPVPCEDQIQLQASMNFQAQINNGTILSPLGIDEDPFYGYASLGFVDPKDGFVFEFRITRNLTYAVYGRVPDTEADCTSFLYLIPVARHLNQACDSYEIVLEKCKGTISYRLGGTEVLRLEVGQKIDEKFRVYGFSENCGCDCPCVGVFPDAVRVRLGNGAMQAVDCCSSQSQPACQRAIFQECFDNIDRACRVNCTYSNTTQPLDTFSVGLASLYKRLSVMETKEVIACERGCSSSSESEGEESPSRVSCAQNRVCRFERRQRLVDNQNRQLAV